jgi:hypothetical protein
VCDRLAVASRKENTSEGGGRTRRKEGSCLQPRRWQYTYTVQLPGTTPRDSERKHEGCGGDAKASANPVKQYTKDSSCDIEHWGEGFGGATFASLSSADGSS